MVLKLKTSSKGLRISIFTRSYASRTDTSLRSVSVSFIKYLTDIIYSDILISNISVDYYINCISVLY